MNLSDIPKSLINTVCESDGDLRNRLLKLALAVQQSPNSDRTKILEKISVFVSLVRLFLETSDKEFNNKLLEIGFTDSFIESLPLISNREDVIKNIQFMSQTEYGKISSLKWRIDISLMNSSLGKKVPMSVILSITLKDNRKLIIEVDPKTFHKLRFNVALMLKELNNLKNNFINK